MGLEAGTKCIDYMEYAREQYQRLYRVTLAFTPENVETAYQVYLNALRRNLDLREALIDYYGYRYRRMENFLREIGFWRAGHWALTPALIKVHSRYISKEKEKNIVIDSEGEYRLPLGEIYLKEEYFKGLIEEALRRLGFETVPVEKIDIDVECYGEVVYEPHTDIETTFKTLVVKGEVKKHTYIDIMLERYNVSEVFE